MGSLGDVQEDAVNKEKEDLEFEVLTPGQAKVKKEL